MGTLADVQGLTVQFPNGSLALERVALSLHEGKVVVLLGPSGAGKSTLLKAIFAPDELQRLGYTVDWVERIVTGEPAYVPQRGALLDHLDAADNIKLAQAACGAELDATAWLEAVDLDGAIGSAGRGVDTLSGGQAQRLAVARVLAAGKKLVVMDEPSVGLDPVGVRMLARLLVTQARKHKLGVIVITHDISLAGGAADEIYFLEPNDHSLTRIEPWSGPTELDDPEVRQQRQVQLDATVEELLLREREPSASGKAKAPNFGDFLAPFRIAGEAIRGIGEPHLFRESMVVLRRTLIQSLVRPALFYAVVGMLLGFTVPYVIANISKDLEPRAVFTLIKGTYILSLAPPLSAIIFVATSGSAISAWLGGLRVNGQVAALEGLGVPARRYLWSPAWLGLSLSYLATFAIFTIAMAVGGYVLYESHGVEHAMEVLLTDFVARPPERRPYLIRALWSVIAYKLALASVVVAKGAEPKSRSDQVTAAMTSSVMRATLFVVITELFTIMLLQMFGG
ncbi:MAG: ATP-binding cassette domain-containing protein [Polyangiaceae bacterium]|nr:ATP-binding cassette domain-containing protein [Polyangiaceae bacterium]